MIEQSGLLGAALALRDEAEAERWRTSRQRFLAALDEGTLLAAHGPEHWRNVETYAARLFPERVLALVAPAELRLLLTAAMVMDLHPPGAGNAAWLTADAARWDLDRAFAGALRRACEVPVDIARFARQPRWLYLGGSAVDLHRVVAVLHVADRLDPEHTDCPPPEGVEEGASWPHALGVAVGLIDPREGVMRLDLTSSVREQRRQAERVFLPWCQEALRAVRNVLLACGMAFREVEVHDLHAKPSADVLQAQESMRARAGARRRPARPFRFLDPFAEDEYHLLAARDEDTIRLSGRALNAPLTVLTGEVGVGKTSLVAAGVIPWLRLHDFEAAYARCLNDPTQALLQAVKERLPDGAHPDTLLGACRRLSATTDGPVVLVLDQAQELFTRLGSQTRLVFAQHIAELLSDPSEPAHLLLVIQREFFVNLTELLPTLPTIMGEVVDLKRLTREQAELVIQRSLGRFRLWFDELVRSHVVDDLCTVEGVLPLELQLVCDHLHSQIDEDETRVGYEVYRKVGSSRRILDGLLEARLRTLRWRRQTMARSILVNCVTAQRTKALLTAEECAVDLGADLAVTREVLEELENLKLLRRLDLGDNREGWELRHEYLAGWLESHLKDAEREAKDVDDLLHRELNNYERFQLLLDREKLRLIHQYRRRLSLTPEELELVIRSVAHERFEVEYWFGRVGELSVSQQMALGIDLLYSSDPEMREVLRQMVSRLDQAAILPTLLASLREADAAVRDTALSLLGDADQQLVQVLAAGDPAEQQQAAYALGQLGVRHAVEPLVTSAHSSKVDEVREQAIEALAEIDRAGAAELLLRSLRAGHPTTRWNAAMALGRLGRDAGVRERLRREAERPQVEVTALFAYARACVEGRQFADAERALHDLERRAVPDNQRPRLEQAFEDLRALKAEEQRGALSWPMYRGSPGGSAYTPSHLSLPLDLKWEFATSDCVYSSPAVSGGTVFIGSDDGHLYALDADSGQERWQSATQGGVRSSPCVIGGTVFVGSLEGFVHAVEVESGRELWRRRVGRSVESSVRGDAERLYVGTGDGAVVAFAPDDGRELWKRPLSGAVIASPAFDDGTLAVGTAEDGLVLLDAASGEVRWRWKVDGGMRGSAALLPHRVVIGSGDGRVDVLDLEGELAWSAFLRGPVGSSPAVAHSRVYVGGTRGEVVALDLDTGATQWMFDAEGEISASPTVAAGVVFVGTQAGQLFGLDARTGEALWRYRTGYSIHSTPAVADRRLFVALRYYNMCAFAEASESDEARP